MTSKSATIDVGGWLQGLGLGQYEATFRENAINEKVLPNLTVVAQVRCWVWIWLETGLTMSAHMPRPDSAEAAGAFFAVSGWGERGG